MVNALVSKEYMENIRNNGDGEYRENGENRENGEMMRSSSSLDFSSSSSSTSFLASASSSAASLGPRNKSMEYIDNDLDWYGDQDRSEAEEKEIDLWAEIRAFTDGEKDLDEVLDDLEF